MTKEKFVTGPINTVRLEGTINGQKKVLYIFFDNHSSVEQQTECTNIRSIEIKNYLIENFDLAKEKNITIDFMIEINLATLMQKLSINQQKTKFGYIWLLWKFAHRNFHIDRKVNKMHLSKNFPNVRFHYVDFRELFLNDILSQILDYFDKNCWCPRQLTPSNVDHLIEKITYMSNRVQYVYNILYDVPITNELLLLSNNKPIHDNPSFINIIKKIKTKYHNKDIQNKINNILNKEVKNIFDEYFKLNEEIMTYLFNLEFDKLLYNLYSLQTLLTKLDDYFNYIGATITDLYFYRRFLDKAYITNVVVYTGGYHGCNHIYYLVKYFDFAITHYSYIYSDNVNDAIKKSNSSVDIRKYFIDSEIYQCSDLSKFPEAFV